MFHPPNFWCAGFQPAKIGRKAARKESDAVWKVIAADMPIGLQVGDGPVLGREFEIAALLNFIKGERIKNVVWLTADVHYCAAHFYDPNHAQFQGFDPFWEFVSGPLNAGSFGPIPLDNTFGPQAVFQKAPPVQNLSPLAGLQFFGQVDIDADNAVMTVRLKDIAGTTVFTKELCPVEPDHDRTRRS